jgi:hypothetical protein
MDEQEIEQDIVFKLLLATSSSCSCLTKTPELKYHNDICTYRVIMEAIDEINELRKINNV